MPFLCCHFYASILKMYLEARACLCDVILSNSNLAGSWKACNWLGILHKVSKMYIFQLVIHLTIFAAIIFGAGASLAWNNTTQLGLGLLETMDKIPWTKWHHKNTVWLLRIVQNGSNNVKFWASSETNFIRKPCTLEAETSTSSYTWCKIFICIDKINMFFWSDLL